mgnify:CR=1 FL=1
MRHTPSLWEQQHRSHKWYSGQIFPLYTCPLLTQTAYDDGSKVSPQNGPQRLHGGLLLLFSHLLLAHNARQNDRHTNQQYDICCQGQPNEKEIASVICASDKNNHHDNADDHCYYNRQSLLVPTPSKSGFFAHSCVLSSHCVALVYNNAEELTISNCPRRPRCGAKVVTRTALSAILERGVFI